MIALTTETGSVIRVLRTGEHYGWHRLFGFVSESAARVRLGNRERHGLKNVRSEWRCRFAVEGEGESWAPVGREGCEILPLGDGRWQLTTPQGIFVLRPDATEWDAPRIAERAEVPDRRRWIAALAAMLPFCLIGVLSRTAPPKPVAELAEPIAVQVAEPKHAVRIPIPQSMPQLASPTKTVAKSGGAMVAQNLGFLGLLGRKDLTKALGGAPTDLTASPGAGPGGKEGSGGELLAGLGQGVKQTTVGNTGVQGLGGVGTKGVGGGGGGYGTSSVGSGGMGNTLKGLGDGRLSATPLSKDIVLEGGLDRAVIQATIAKYLSQVRSCYEEGLRGTPGLSGQVTMKFEIGGEGRLNFAQVGKSSLGHAGVEGCISKRMMDWQFPKPLGGVSVKVAYPFLLRPVSS